MPFITLLTDFGDSDYYVASVKAGIMRENAHIAIVDISHNIQKFNLPHAAFILRSVFREFPEGTIHIISVNGQSSREDIYILANIEGHYFICTDSGLLSLISDSEPEIVVRLRVAEERDCLFPARAIYVPVALKLCSGIKPEEIGELYPALRKMINLQPRLTHSQIIGQVIHVDSFGNLITNIEKPVFEKIGKGRGFVLSFSREKMHHISKSYLVQEPGDCLAVFNSNNLLEIAINMGNASELLGLYYGSPVMVNFEGE